MAFCTCSPDCPREVPSFGGRRLVHPLCHLEQANRRRRGTHPRRVRAEGYDPVPGDLTSTEIEAIVAAELARMRHARQVRER